MEGLSQSGETGGGQESVEMEESRGAPIVAADDGTTASARKGGPR